MSDQNLVNFMNFSNFDRFATHKNYVNFFQMADLHDARTSRRLSFLSLFCSLRERNSKRTRAMCGQRVGLPLLCRGNFDFGKGVLVNYNIFQKHSPGTVSFYSYCILTSMYFLFQIAFVLCDYDWHRYLKYYYVPLLFYGLWLVMITYLQHQDEEIEVYEGGNWTYVKVSRFWRRCFKSVNCCPDLFCLFQNLSSKTLM